MDDFLEALLENNSKLSVYIRESFGPKHSSELPPHKIGRPAGSDELEMLRALGGEDLRVLYERCNGLRLCAPDEHSGILIFPIADITTNNMLWKNWFSDLDDDELWDFQKSGLAFGEIIETGNYLVLHDARVFYADHEGAEGDDPWAQSLSEFFSRIANEPSDFLDRML
jgi:hypothetical protein